MKIHLIINTLAPSNLISLLLTVLAIEVNYLVSLTPLVMAQTRAGNQNDIPSVGTVKCTLLTDQKNNRRVITEATLIPTLNGYDLKFSDPLGNYLLRLDYKLIISEALTLGDEPTQWNLIGYLENPTPVMIKPNGDFSISMMVSTRSSCTFKGQLTFAPGAKEKLFGL